MLVPAPESTSRVAFAEPGVRLEHLYSAVGFEHDLSALNGVPFGDVGLEVDVVFGESEFAERKPMAFQVMERLGAGVDVALFPEAVVAVLGHKHQGHPVVAGVTRNLFRATARYNLHRFLNSSRANTGAGGTPATRDKKRVSSVLRKRRRTAFHLRVFTVVQTKQYSPPLVIKK